MAQRKKQREKKVKRKNEVKDKKCKHFEVLEVK